MTAWVLALHARTQMGKIGWLAACYCSGGVARASRSASSLGGSLGWLLLARSPNRRKHRETSD